MRRQAQQHRQEAPELPSWHLKGHGPREEQRPEAQSAAPRHLFGPQRLRRLPSKGTAAFRRTLAGLARPPRHRDPAFQGRFRPATREIAPTRRSPELRKALGDVLLQGPGVVAPRQGGRETRHEVEKPHHGARDA